MVMKVTKVTALPSTFTPDTLYIVGEGTVSMKMFMSDKLGAGVRPLSVDVNTSFSKYDLATGTTTGVLDLALRQVFTLTNNTAGQTTQKDISITNAPATGKAMTVVLQVVGKVAPIGFPNFKKADGVDFVLGDVSTLFVILVLDGVATITTTLRVNA